MDGLFGSQTIEVGIGLALFFLLVSLICTAAREAFEGMMKSRAVDLERGLRELLGDPDGQSVMRDLFAHPMIFGLFGGVYDPANLKPKATLFPTKDGTRPMVMRFGKARGLPSYIPASQFATALIDLVARGPATPAPLSNPTAPVAPTAPLTVEGLRQAAAAFPNVAVRRAIITGLDAAGDDIDALKKHLEDWFDGTMDRVSGWYKRRTQALLFWVGLIAAAVLNLDTLTILDRLGKDEHLRDAAVKAAEAQIERGQPGTTPPAADPAAPANAAPTAPPAAPAGKGAGGEGVGGPDKAADPKEQIAALREQLDDIGYPIGWKDGVPGPQSVVCRMGTGAPSKMSGRPIRGDVLDPADPRCRVGPLTWSKPILLQNLERVTKDGQSRWCATRGYEPKSRDVLPADAPACAGGLRAPGADYRYVVAGWPLMPVGWLITALAVMLGAPFWFDVLNRFMIVRATVKPKEKSPNEPSPDPLKPQAAPQVAPQAPAPADGAASAAAGHHLPGGAAPGAGAATPAAPPFTPHQWKDRVDPDEGAL